jgi:hypothetical protein
MSRIAIVATAATVLGLSGAALFCASDGSLLGAWGANLLAWTALFAVLVFLLARRLGISLDSDGRWFAIPMLFFAATFIWRSDPFLRFWNGVLMFVCAAFLLMRSRAPKRAADAGYWEYVRIVFASVGCALFMAGKLRDDFPESMAP